MPAMGRQLGRRPGRTPGQNVGASQRRHKALPAMGRQLGRRAEAPQGEMLAPRNGYTWLCRHWGANSVGDRPSLRVKCWRPATEAQGFAGNGAPTWPVPGPPFPVFSARGWCTNPRRPLFFRSLCTKSPDLFSARPARTWCTNPRKTLFFRPLCTKSPGLFGARPARTWCTNPRKTCYEVTVVKRRLQESFFSRHGTFVFFLTASGKSFDLTVPGMWPLCYSWIGYLQANGPP